MQVQVVIQFSELKRGIDGISQRTLTLTLRTMERDGLVTRNVAPSIPPRVDYELSLHGHSLTHPTRALEVWARTNWKRSALDNHELMHTPSINDLHPFGNKFIIARDGY